MSSQPTLSDFGRPSTLSNDTAGDRGIAPIDDPAPRHLHVPAVPDDAKPFLLSRITAVPLPTSAGASFNSPSPVTPVTPTSHPRKPSEAGLHLRTDLATPTKRNLPQAVQGHDVSIPEITHPANVQTPRPWPLLHARSFDSVASATSSLASPALAALTDITPLPSPITLASSPELWRKLVGRPHSGSGASLASLAREEMAGYLSAAALSTSPNKKKKQYAGLGITGGNTERTEDLSHTRTISEYVPDPLVNVRPRTRTVSGTSPLQNSHHELNSSTEQNSQHVRKAQLSVPEVHHMHREQYLAKQRGFIDEPGQRPPETLLTPPPSNGSLSLDQEEQTQAGQEEFTDLLIVRDVTTKVKNYWRPLRKLGQGAFSEVFLAKRELPSDTELVAIKIVSHVPAPGHGDDDERMETSIQREIEILQSLSHPCLPRLKAFDTDDKRALLVLNYCPGGDLFELASQRRDLLTPPLVQRIFAELVAAVAYLHGQMIVHRDIKLENVLFNISPSQLPALPPPLSHYASPLITLTDLGLSKHISPPPASPLLTHACGSADYAAPELLLGQPYDGRVTDAWALGVVLYALMEGRLPFDPLPVSEGMSGAEVRRRRRGQHVSVKHRIARCDWLWCELGDDEGQWAGQEGWDGARECVEGCLKKVGRGRWTVTKLREKDWVKEGLVVGWACL